MGRPKQDCDARRYYKTNVNMAMSLLELRHLAQQGNTPIQATRQIAVCYEAGNSHCHDMVRQSLEPEEKTLGISRGSKGV